MKKAIGYLLLSSILFLILFIAPPIFAQDSNPIYCLNGGGIQTAIGCIPTDPSGLAQKIFTLSIGMAGGIAFLMIILGAMQIQISSGNPERINSGKEVIEGAIIGLLLILLSVFILKVIGVDIIGIPGFQ